MVAAHPPLCSDRMVGRTSSRNQTTQAAVVAVHGVPRTFPQLPQQPGIQERGHHHSVSKVTSFGPERRYSTSTEIRERSHPSLTAPRVHQSRVHVHRPPHHTLGPRHQGAGPSSVEPAGSHVQVDDRDGVGTPPLDRARPEQPGERSGVGQPAHERTESGSDRSPAVSAAGSRGGSHEEDCDGGN